MPESKQKNKPLKSALIVNPNWDKTIRELKNKKVLFISEPVHGKANIRMPDDDGKKIQILEKEKAASSKENDRAKGSLEKMKQLEVAFRKLKKDGSTARIKIKNVLQKIEKMDFV